MRRYIRDIVKYGQGTVSGVGGREGGGRRDCFMNYLSATEDPIK